MSAWTAVVGSLPAWWIAWLWCRAVRRDRQLTKQVLAAARRPGPPVTAPAFGPALVTLGWFLALPLAALATMRIHDWWRNHHPRTEERP